MKSYQFRNVIVLVILLVGVVSTSWAGTKVWDFAKDAGGMKPSHGKWEVKGGIYQEVLLANYVDMDV